MPEHGPRERDVLSNEETMRRGFDELRAGKKDAMFFVRMAVDNYFKDRDHAGAVRILEEGVTEGLITAEQRNGMLARGVREVVERIGISSLSDEPIDPAATLERLFSDTPEVLHIALDILLNDTERRIADQEARLRILRNTKRSVENMLNAMPSA